MAQKKGKEPVTQSEGLKVQWFGHACFLFTSSDGIRVLTDPFDESVGYQLPRVEADVVLISHDHFDHNNVSVVKGKPTVVRGEGQHEASGLTFLGVSSFHDEAGGRKRGKNTIFTWEMDGMRLAHLGDLGNLLTDDQVERIGNPDMVFIPVGGHFTIDAAAATKVVGRLSPKLVFPMHYKTRALGRGFPISGVEEFTSGKENVEQVDANFIVVKKEDLPTESRIIVLGYR